MVQRAQNKALSEGGSPSVVSSWDFSREKATSSDTRAVACAAELFLHEGIEGVTMVEIARAAGVGVATLYRHFNTKAQLAVAAAMLLWGQFNQQVKDLVDSQEFLSLSGLDRLRVLFESYCEAYEAHGDFVAFLDEFDRLVLRGQVPQDELDAYAAQLESFYPVFAESFALGVEDGTVRPDVDFRTCFLALSHALMSVAQKIGRGEVLRTDDFTYGANELKALVDMAVWALAVHTPVAVEGR